MEKLITIDNLHNFAYCNHKLCKSIKGIVISFFGLGGCTMFAEDTEDGKKYAAKDIVLLVPYQNPWAWMNKQTVDYTDELIDVLFETYDLPKDTPVVSTGGSMGGLSALVYTAYAKRTPVACVANCPVCDLPYHYTERPDLPRTLYSAFGTYEGTMQSALESASPLHLTDKLPKTTKYYVFHCEEDKAVNKQQHSDRFVEKMKTDHSIDYFAVAGRGHCDLTDEMRALYTGFVVSAIEG